MIVEATYDWYRAADLLEEMGYQVHLADPQGTTEGTGRGNDGESLGIRANPLGISEQATSPLSPAQLTPRHYAHPMVERDGSEMFNVMVTRANPFRSMPGVSVDWGDSGGEDGSLYPLTSPTSQSGILPELDDGDSYAIEAGGFSLHDNVGGRWNQLFHAGNVKVGLLVTECRVVAVCEKWRQFPSPYVVAGHIRYNWLQTVSFGSALPFGAKQLLLVCTDGEGPHGNRHLRLSLSFPAQVRRPEADG